MVVAAVDEVEGDGGAGGDGQDGFEGVVPLEVGVVFGDVEGVCHDGGAGKKRSR